MPKILARAARSEVERPSSRDPEVPPELDRICVEALAHEPSGRTSSALSRSRAVESYLEGDRDLLMRRTEAARLLDVARERLANAGDDDASARIVAMREALKALALVPDDEEAQRLLLSLVVDGSGKLPADAEAEFAASDDRVRHQGIGYGIAGYVLWLLALPLVIWAGVRMWAYPIALTAMTLVCIVYAVIQRRNGARSRVHALLLATLTAAIVALSSAWLGPFVLAPLAACATAMMFLVHGSKTERPWLLGIWSVAALLPFAIEQLGVVPPAYTFRGDELVLHARALELPRGPTLATLAYTSVAFIVLLGFFIGRLRDKQREAERRLFVQAWHLRQLFPSR
jgi:serine/threonine-protein kinase